MEPVVASAFRIGALAPHRVKEIRRQVARSTIAFQHRFGIPASTITNWEQGRRVTDPATALLLRVIEADPHLVERVARGEPVVMPSNNDRTNMLPRP